MLLLEIPDPIYGSIKIYNEKILRIVQSSLFERLKGIRQAGIDTACGARNSCSRYEHSLGTYELVRRLSSDEFEQIFALLHDIYHTNFSHTIDFMTENSDVSFHEVNKYNFFQNIDNNPLIEILGPNWMSYMTNSENHPITKNNGADKIDYLLRDGYYIGLFSHTFINDVITHLSVIDNRIVCSNRRVIKEFYDYSKILTDEYYNGAQTKGLAIIFCALLKFAFHRRYINQSDIYYGYKSDAELWDTILQIEDFDIQYLLKFLNANTAYKCFPSGTCRLRGYQLLRANVPNRLRYTILPLFENNTVQNIIVEKNINNTHIDVYQCSRSR